MANFDDLDPLAQEPNLRVSMVPAGRPLPGDADLVLIPGTKSTIKDLVFFRAQGWDIDLMAHLRRGGRVLGVCGGYQMLGHVIDDPEGVEGPAGKLDGLGLLDVHTTMVPEKRVSRASAVHLASGMPVRGYEIHIGNTKGPDCARPLFELAGGQPEGAQSAGGQVAGTYLHGLFWEDGFRHAWLAAQGVGGGLAYGEGVEAVLEALAAHLEQHLNLDALLEIAR